MFKMLKKKFCHLYTPGIVVAWVYGMEFVQ